MMKKNSLMKIKKEKQGMEGAHSLELQKAHHTNMSLFLCHKMITMDCFVWPLALQL